MVWTTPTLIEICIGLEINGYLQAEFGFRFGFEFDGLTGIGLGARRVAAFRINCNCNVCRIAGAGEKRVRTRTLASLATSGDGERWTLINVSPDLRAHPE